MDRSDDSRHHFSYQSWEELNMSVDTKLYVEVHDDMAERIDVIKRAGSVIEDKIRE